MRKGRTPVLLMSHALGAGGGERQLALTALGMKRYQAHVAAVQGGHWVKPLEDAGVPLYWVRSRSLLSFHALREGQRLSQYLRSQNIALVHSFDYTMNLFGMPVAACTRGVIPVAAQRCEMGLVPPRYRRPTVWAHKMSGQVVVNSSRLRDELVQDFGERADRISVCFNGVDTAMFTGSPAERIPVSETQGASLVIACVCVLRPEKNLALLIEAFRKVQQPGWRLLLVGDGPERQALAAQASGLDCVFVPSTNEVFRYLRAAHIFVLASRSEGLSNSIMEAMASGCAVAATRVGGNPELVEHGQTGLLFENASLEGLTAALQRLADPAERHRLAEAGQRRMRNDFSLESAVERIEALYDRLLLEPRA